MKKYYSLYKEENSVDIDIYGEITSWEWSDRDVSSYTLVKELQELKDVDTINVRINSYGGEVAEGLAIYNALKSHKAKIKTYCDGFACSIASVIFMAGDERIMSDASLLMIHNAWTYASGDANSLRKQADDLEIITSASINTYMNHINITEEELKEMLNIETWIDPQSALKMNFATKIETSKENNNPSQSVKNKILEKFLNNKKDNDISNKLDYILQKLEEKENQVEKNIKNQIENTQEENKNILENENSNQTDNSNIVENSNENEVNQSKNLSLLQKIKKNKEQN